MAYETYTITNFGGLNEIDPPDDVGIEGAQALSDVDWDKTAGSIRQRYGSDGLVAAEAGTITRLYAHSATRLLSAHSNTTVEVYNESGTSQTSTTVTGGNIDFTTIGTPSATYTFFGDGTATIWSYNGTSITAGSSAATVDGTGSRAMPKGKYLATDPDSNRLVVAGTASSGGPHGATSSASHVWFSEPGDPFGWTSTNFVILSPGDGEDTRAAVTWQGQVFVFKRSRIFVFYGESTDPDGNPIFNYRTIELSNDLKVWGGSFSPVACVGPDGVYYAGERGVFVTSGDMPFRISDPLDWSDSNQNTTGYIASPAVVGEKLYVGRQLPTGQSADAFNQTSGALHGKTADSGGTWTTSGDTTDLAVSGSGTVTRTAIEHRVAVLGSALSSTEAGVDVKWANNTAVVSAGLTLRYVDADNFARALVNVNNGVWSIGLYKVVAGTLTSLSTASETLSANTFYRLRASVSEGGVIAASVDNTQITATDSDLATGGVLESGKAGIYHIGDGTYAVTYDNFVAYQPGANGVYVYDMRTQQWGDHRGLLTASNLTNWLDTETLYSDFESKTIRKLDDSDYTDDDGTDISSHWTSGLSDLGYESEKRLRYIDVWGTGTVSLSTQTDFEDATNATTLTLGTSPAIAKARYETSAKGTLVGIKLSSVDGAAWKVHRIVLHYEATKSPAAKR